MQSNLSRLLAGLLHLVLMFTSVPASAESTSLYALYRSEDNAQSWTRSDLGLPRDSRINALAATAQTFIAGTDAGIFVSTNAAKSWQSIAETKSARVLSLATLKQLALAGTIDGLLTSTNHGLAWQRNPSFPRHVIRSLHVLDESIYIGTDAHHVYQSTNRGQTWIHLSAGLPKLSQTFALTSLNGRLFAGLYGKGLYAWDNPEKKWSQVGATAKIAPLAVAATADTLIAGHNPGGIYSSDDLGQTWRHWSLSPLSPQPADSSFSFLDSLNTKTSRGSVPAIEAPIWEMSANSKIAIAGAGSGIYYSTDRALTWTRTTSGLPVQSSGIAFLLHENLILAAIHQKPDCSNPAPQK